MNSATRAYDPGVLAGRLDTAVSAPATCPLCANTATVCAFTDAGCQVRVCNDCELFFVHPYPRDSDQHRYVSSGEYPGIELLDCVRRYQGERLYYDRHFNQIARECAGANSILDVGCGTGNLLERFAFRPSCFRLGIELNRAAAQLARYTAQCEILEQPFEEFRSVRKFDAITLINVFSHISSFDSMFQSLRAALAPSGRVILRTTEMSRRVSRWNQVHWGVPDDLHFLGLKTLEFLCAKYGFTVAQHIRVPFEDELFRPSRWQQMGRIHWHNAAKKIAIRIPGTLKAARTLYSAALGQRLFVSLIVLRMNSEAGRSSGPQRLPYTSFPGGSECQPQPL